MESEQIKRVRRTSAEIKSLLATFQQSDITAKDFCEAHGITEGVFYKWKTRYLKPSVKEPGFITVQSVDALQGRVLFAEVNGIRLYQAVTASYLKELLA